MKRLLSLVAAAALCAALSVTAVAQETALGTIAGQTVSAGEEGSYLVTSLDLCPKFYNADGRCTITYQGKTVFSGTTAQANSFVPANHGVHQVSVSSWGEESLFLVDYRLPIRLYAEKNIDQGETLVVHAYFAGDLKLSAKTDLGFTPTFFQKDGEQIALVPVRNATAPGQYNLTVTASDGLYTYETQLPIQVTKRDFIVQYLTMPQSTAQQTVQNNAANNEWDAKIEPLKLIGDPVQRWEGLFIQPVQGNITTEYGCTRYTNNDPVPSRHGGLDIAAPRGAAVSATNSGRVLFADYIALTGNTVVIEHGYGLKSWYYHMDGLNVQAGDLVEKGQQVGIVGSTGYSTGPHLHFALSVNTVFVNPWTAFAQELISQ